MSSIDVVTSLTEPLRRQLLTLAGESIRAGFGGGRLTVCPDDYPEPLRLQRASFVTLHIEGCLRGCIGSLEAHRALVEDVASNAYSAAFTDPRFPALIEAEFDRTDIHLSLLSVPQPVTFSSEEDLIGQLRPHVDGVVLEEGYRRGTFLPSVWQELPEPREFLRHLKQKAGLRAGYWSNTLVIKRYIVESFP